MKKIRILSLDGGGIRGVIPATVLVYVEQKLGEVSGNPNARLADYFDLMVGTSTGGILSCFYLTPSEHAPETTVKGPLPPTTKFTAKDALNFYVRKGEAIFNKSKHNGWMGLRQLFNATQYDPTTIETIFKEQFGDLKMHELLANCLVPAYCLSYTPEPSNKRHVSKSAFFFSSREPADKQREFYVRDVVRSTSAAPTYFPPAYITNLRTQAQMVNIDGGVFANNPTMCAFAECQGTKFPQLHKYPDAEDMLILSIGTGGGSFDLPDVKDSNSWGVINWAKSIPDIMMDGSVDTVDFQIQRIFRALGPEVQRNYKRVDVPIDQRHFGSMADASEEHIKQLQVAGEATLNAAQQDTSFAHTLDRFVELLVEHHPESPKIDTPKPPEA